MRTRWTSHTLAVALSAAGALGACSGGGGAELSRGQFITKADAECSSLAAASDEFHKAQDPAAQGAEVRRFVREVADRLRLLVRRLDAIVPPEPMQDNVDRLLAGLAEYADGLDQLADKTQQDETFAAVIQANPELVGRMNAEATKVGTVVGELGLVDCILPS